MHLSTVVEIAADIRRRARLPRLPFSTKRIVEVCFPGTLVTGGNLPRGVEEMVTRPPCGAIIVYARSLSGPAQRFAIAHGLGHLWFNDHANPKAHARPGYRGDPALEDRADAFAAELLAPISMIRDLVRRRPSKNAEDHELYLDHVDDLASRFAVPAEVIDARIRELEPARKVG